MRGPVERLRTLRPSARPGFLTMPSWYATPFVESLLFIASVLEHHGFAYTAHKGTLLGAWRLGGVLPWDDDADLFLIDTDAEEVTGRLSGVLDEHGFVLRFREPGYYFDVFPRLPAALHMGCLTELGLLTRSIGEDGYIYDAHDPLRRLDARELFPLRRVPFQGSWIAGPQDSEAAVRRMYGDLADPSVMTRHQAPALHPDVAAFWSEARSYTGDLDWERVSRRVKERAGSPRFVLQQVPCAAWYLANQGYWRAVDAVRRRAGGSP